MDGILWAKAKEKRTWQARLRATGRGSEAAIWERLMRHGKKVFSREAARYVLELRFPDEDKARMHELSLKARQARLTPQEQEEVEIYSRVGSILGALKSRARMTLKNSA
jgi:hypothetical protein